MSALKFFNKLAWIWVCFGLSACSSSSRHHPPVAVLVPAAVAEPMTPGRFREIVAMPGDATPLVPPLAAIPFWPHSVVSNVMTYATGQVFSEVLTQSARPVSGRYVVFTVQSQFYDQPMTSLLTYDEAGAVLKEYGLFGDGHGSDLVTEGTVIYDYTRHSYTASAAYGDGFTETTQGAYFGDECLDQTRVYQHGVLFMTRKTWTHPVPAGK